MLEFQRLILADDIRNRSFMQALKKALQSHPGATVADIGAGTGYLTVLAKQMGAGRCYLYEVSDLADLARKILKANAITDCTVVEMHSTEVRKPEQVDVIVSETLGNFALEEGILETLKDAVRFLKKDGIMLPQQLRQYIAPITKDRLWKEINTWDHTEGVVDLEVAKEIALQNMYVKTVQESDLLKSSAQEWDHIVFGKKEENSVRKRNVSWNLPSSGTLYGLALWWDTLLCPGVSLSTSPSEPLTHWQQVVLPVLQPIVFQSGDVLEVDLVSDTRPQVKVALKWVVRLRDAKKKVKEEQVLDTKKGFL